MGHLKDKEKLFFRFFSFFSRKKTRDRGHGSMSKILLWLQDILTPRYKSPFGLPDSRVILGSRFTTTLTSRCTTLQPMPPAFAPRLIGLAYT